MMRIIKRKTKTKTGGTCCDAYDPCYVNKKKLNSVAVVRKRTIPTERPPLVGEVSAKLCG
jgi:hypothetical protein